MLQYACKQHVECLMFLLSLEHPHVLFNVLYGCVVLRLNKYACSLDWTVMKYYKTVVCILLFIYYKIIIHLK